MFKYRESLADSASILKHIWPRRAVENRLIPDTMAGHKEVVISGIAGYFPNCNNVEELKETLFSKTNGITIDSRRWIKGMAIISVHRGAFSV